MTTLCEFSDPCIKLVPSLTLHGDLASLMPRIKKALADAPADSMAATQMFGNETQIAFQLQFVRLNGSVWAWKIFYPNCMTGRN